MAPDRSNQYPARRSVQDHPGAGFLISKMELNCHRRLAFGTMEAVMAQDNQKTTNEPKRMPPDLQDVEPGSDADASPVPEVGKTPRDPNKPSDDDAKIE